MTILAQSRLGRIALHLLAMFGDRCVRFHVAGIIREIAPAAADSRVAHFLNLKTLRKQAQSLGPYFLAAAILPGGIVLVPLLLLYRRRKAAVLRITEASAGPAETWFSLPSLRVTSSSIVPFCKQVTAMFWLVVTRQEREIQPCVQRLS